jgi:transposase-like protein
LADTPYPLLLVDALVRRIREDGPGRPRAGCVGMGVHAAGPREIRGVGVGDSESEATGRTVCPDLKARGLHGVDRVVSDQHAGLGRALPREFPGTPGQRCQTHCRRNVLDAGPQALHDPLHAAGRAVCEAPDRRRADGRSQQLITDFQETAPKAVAIWEAGVEDALAILADPPVPHERPGGGQPGDSPAGAGHPHLPAPGLGGAAVGRGADGVA